MLTCAHIHTQLTCKDTTFREITKNKNCNTNGICWIFAIIFP